MVHHIADEALGVFLGTAPKQPSKLTAGEGFVGEIRSEFDMQGENALAVAERL
jgi:hypothetical protein